MALPHLAAADLNERRPAMLSPGAAADVAPQSAVSWPAILAGAAAAAALSLILLMLGSGLGLSALSPWAGQGMNATGFGIAAVAWLTVTQVMSSGMGGYLAGRLRVRWSAVHTDEVYFRDTAHGFLAWAVASLLSAAVLGSALSAAVGSGVRAGSAAVAAVAQGSGDTVGYFVDALYRQDAALPAASVPATPAPPELGAESARIISSALLAGSLPANDMRYLGQLIAQRTGLAPQDAEKRASDTFSRLQVNLKEAQDAARAAADKARKASAYAALWLFVSLLAGAFAASLAATYGGRERDA